MNRNWKHLTPSYQHGGINAINKEGAKHGASGEQIDYAKGLYTGASDDQKKKAMSLYEQYKQTGNIPAGAEDLFNEVGGDSSMLYAKKGGAVGSNGIL
jgi:hypothetical protein